MSQTNFQKVSMFNELIGNPKGSMDTAFGKANALLEASAQLELICDELNELVDAVASGDFKEIRKEIQDVLVTTYGLAHRMGIDADKDMELVDQSNMSKFCISHNEIRLTEEHFKKKEVEIYFRGEVPHMAVISAKNQMGNDGKLYPKGKALKPPMYKEPDFD